MGAWKVNLFLELVFSNLQKLRFMYTVVIAQLGRTVEKAVVTIEALTSSKLTYLFNISNY